MKHIPDQEAQSLLKRTHEIEAEKAARQAERLEKKRLKAQQEKNQAMEKLVAPILLLVTIGISMIVWLAYQF